MNKKLIILLLSVSLLQAPVAQAGFFDTFKMQLAAIGLAFANIFRSKTPPRVPTEQTEELAATDSTVSPSPVLAEDPNNYQVSAQVDPEPASAECIPRTMAHRCSYLESDQVVANTCVNPVPIRNGQVGGSSGVRSNN